MALTDQNPAAGPQQLTKISVMLLETEWSTWITGERSAGWCSSLVLGDEGVDRLQQGLQDMGGGGGVSVDDV